MRTVLKTPIGILENDKSLDHSPHTPQSAICLNDSKLLLFLCLSSILRNLEFDMMNYSKGDVVHSKGGGMRSHLPASPGNNPTKSKTCNLTFSGKNCPKGSSSARHHTASKQSGV